MKTMPRSQGIRRRWGLAGCAVLMFMPAVYLVELAGFRWSSYPGTWLLLAGAAFTGSLTWMQIFNGIGFLSALYLLTSREEAAGIEVRLALVFLHAALGIYLLMQGRSSSSASERCVVQEDHWSAALAEYEGRSARLGLRARLFAENAGDEARTKADYLRIRAAEIAGAEAHSYSHSEHQGSAASILTWITALSVVALFVALFVYEYRYN